jgi:tetratricopeptide (TPR) repeat protein
LDQVFVSRQRELKRLDSLLESASGGSGQICFVVAEAGFGKTSLTAEFARRAQLRDEELLVVVGDCNAQTGIGDPYLPFREILGMLAGDIDDKVAQGVTTEENASRLRSFLRVSKRIILDVGPDLIDILVPGVGLVTRAGAMVASDSGLGKRRSTSQATGGAHPSAADTSLHTDQSRIFEQVTTVLVALARQRPLVLILDDLQWVDESSASLLFHLARRIEGSRMLIIGTYRPEDVALGRGDQRHPLSTVVSELKRYYGDCVISLDESDDTEERQFIDALLDVEANKLGENFRSALLQHTRGHPLFTTELLRDMQERGDLVQDDDNQWIEGRSLDWNALPARVEGVIEERINRLSNDIREMLTIASVEGETFTAQVIARLQEITERELLKTLSQEVDRQHRLVTEEGSERIGKIRISQFRFRHHMFQKYLYGALGESERELLHEDIAAVLEALYGAEISTVAVQLARHYEQARLEDKAAAFFLQAGQRALALYAHSEAMALAERGLTCLNRIGDVTEYSELLLEFNLLLGEAQHRAGLFAESMETYRQAAELAIKLGAPVALARAALGYDEPRWRCNLLEDTAVKFLTQALEMLGDEDSVLRVSLIGHLVMASQGSTGKDEITAMLNDAVAMARRLDDPHAIIDSMRTRLMVDRDPGGIRERIELIEEMLEIARQLDDKHQLIESTIFHIVDILALGDADGWVQDLTTQHTIVESIGEPFYEYSDCAMRTAPVIQAGRFDEAEKMAMEAFAAGRALGVDNAEGVLGIQMFTIRREQGRLQEIAPVLKQFVDEETSAAWRPGLALIYAEIGHLEEAGAELDLLATDDFAILPRDSLWQTSLVYLAEVCDYLQDTDRAQRLYGLLMPYAELAVVVGNAIVCLGATSRFLGQLATVQSNWDDAEMHFRHALDLNASMSATPWIAHTQYQYSRMLSRRGTGGDIARASELLDAALITAHELGMHGLIARIKSSASAC